MHNDGDSLISHDEAGLVTYLGIEGSWEEGKRGEIKNMKGIEAFINLNTLRCSYNLITSLNLSGNTSLTFLPCNKNQLTSLDVSNNTSLEKLKCRMNQLSSLEVSGCISLTELDFERNQLVTLDISNLLSTTRIPAYETSLRAH